VYSSSHLIMCIDPKLKAQLREQARRGGCSLSQYVERELLRLLPASTKTRKGQAAARQPRGAHLAIRVGRDLKLRLERLAAEEYRTLASFVEIQLHAIVAAYRENPIRPPCAVERRKHLGPDWQPRRSRVATSLSAQLKAQLKKLADEDYRELGNFIEVELGHLAATHNDHRAEPVLQRRPRSARLVVRVSNQLKARLQRLADEDSRSLTDFTEIRLRKIVTNPHRRLLTQ
jgi:predicted HicB family RNase H-like nuclease